MGESHRDVVGSKKFMNCYRSTMVVVSVSYKPTEEDALLRLLDSLKGSFAIRVSGTIDQIASQMGMPCYRCGGPVNFSKRKLPNDDIFMLYMLIEQDVTIESIPKMINGGFENIRTSKDVRKMCESMRSMCLDCKNVANPIEDVQILDHRSLSEKAETETSRGSHIPSEPVEHKKSEKKRTLENVPELPNRKIPKAGHSPSTSPPPVNQDHHVEKEDSMHNISRSRDVKEELLEDSLQDLVDKPTSTAACAHQDSGVEVMKFQSSNEDYPTATAEIGTQEIDITSQFDVDAKHFVMPVAGLNNLNNMNVVVPKRAPRRSAPVSASVTKSLSSAVANIATVVHYEWQQAQCKKCLKPLKVKNTSGWKNRIKATAMSHVRMHMSIQPFFCEVCQWGCNQFSSIAKHMMDNHPLDRDRFQDRTNQDSFIEEATKVLYECFDCDPQ